MERDFKVATTLASVPGPPQYHGNVYTTDGLPGMEANVLPHDLYCDANVAMLRQE